MKLIATDLDGTLLNEQGKISPENVQAIKKATDLGIKFVVATGRSYGAASGPLKDAGLISPIISMNGAVTYDTEGNVMREALLDKTVARQIQLACEKEEIYFEVFTSNGIYSTSREYFIEVMVDVLRTINPDASEKDLRESANMRFQEEPVEFISDYDRLFTMNDLKIYKILAFSINKEKLVRVQTELKDEAGITITSSGDINLEFNNPDAQKGIALEELANDLGIEMQDVMALGDNFNDVSMLEKAGRGVAMGNAADAIKEVCSYSTDSNSNHGVALAIEEMLKEITIG